MQVVCGRIRGHPGIVYQAESPGDRTMKKLEKALVLCVAGTDRYPFFSIPV
jgi:hypothetical protein